ncbi:MAG TPA: hypothetical protein VFX30_03245 [bacterium]|nr:hypothetical protein [bacterium]
MFAFTPATSQIGQSLHYLFMGGTLQPTSLPSRDLRAGISQALWREGSQTARNLAWGLIKAEGLESYTTTVTALADHFSQNSDFAAALTQGVAERAKTNPVFAQELVEAARSSFEALMKGGDELPPSSDSRRRRRSDAPYASIWEASVQRIVDPEV